MPFCAPQIVYSNSWLSQTSSISSTVVYTFPSEGIFRISASMYVFPASGSYEVDSEVTIVDAPNQPSPIQIGYNQGFGDVQQCNARTGVFAGTSGQEVQFEATLAGGGTLDHYDAYLVIEQLA